MNKAGGETLGGERQGAANGAEPETDSPVRAFSLTLDEAPLADGLADGGTQPDVNAAEAALAASPRSIKPHGPLYALSFRNFRLFFYGQLISVAGTWMQSVAQQTLVWNLTHSARWLGIVSGAGAIPFVLFTLWGGQIADRYPRRTTLVWTQTVMMLLAFVLAVLATNRIVPVQAWHVAVLAGLLNVVNALNMPAQQAFVTDMVDDRAALSNAIALSSLRFNLARFIGPILAGGVVYKLGIASCFTLNGLSFLAVIASLLMMRLKPFTPRETSGSVWGGFHYIRQEHRVLRIVLLVGAASLLAWSTSTLFPLLADRYIPAVFHTTLARLSPDQRQRYSALLLGRLMAANGIGAAIGAFGLAAFGERIPRALLIYGGAFAFGVALLFVAGAPTFTLLQAYLVISGIAMIIFGMSCNTQVQQEAPDALRGRVMAVYTLTFGGLMPVGGLEIGFLAQRINATQAIRGNAALCLIVTAFVLAWRLSERRRPAPEPARG